LIYLYVWSITISSACVLIEYHVLRNLAVT